MIKRLFMGALVIVSAACTTPVSPSAPEAWACRDAVRGAAIQAYALARYRDDQRAVILLPAGKAAAEYETETRRLRDEGARLLAALKANDPEAEQLPPPPPLAPASVTAETVAGKIASADACLANAG